MSRLTDAAAIVVGLRPAAAALALNFGGGLTDGELEAIKAARDILSVAKLINASTGGDETADAVLQLLAVFPVDALASLVVRWRAVHVRAASLNLGVGPLGAGVKVVGHP